MDVIGKADSTYGVFARTADFTFGVECILGFQNVSWAFSPTTLNLALAVLAKAAQQDSALPKKKMPARA